tara:strand:- start:123 stop:641 length:519 start_codon:yes stop_codon:yes gene_type:complete
MKLTKSQLRKLIKEELKSVLNEGDLPKFEEIPQEYKDLARKVVQEYINKQKPRDWETGIHEIFFNAWGASGPNKEIGLGINNELVGQYPDEAEAHSWSPTSKFHPYWLELSHGMQEEAKNLHKLAKGNPNLDGEKIKNALKRDWVSVAEKLGASIEKRTPYNWAALRAHPDD